MTIITIGIDPGLSSGLAVLWDGQRDFVIQDEPHAMVVALKRQLDLMRSIADLHVRIGIERFIVTPETGRKSQQSNALRIIGMVELVALEADVPLHKQTVADVKKLTDNARLRALGLYVKPRDVEQPDANDANDAMRHAVYCTAVHHTTVFDQMLRRARLVG